MQDDIKAQALRQVKVPFQKVLLKAVELFRFPALGRPVEVIQARFPDGGQGNVLRLPEKLVRPVCRGVMGIVRMDAQRTKTAPGNWRAHAVFASQSSIRAPSVIMRSMPSRRACWT